MELKKFRKMKNLTQEELAKKINMSVSTYRGYELEVREPSHQVLILLADFYNITVDELLGRKFTQTMDSYDEDMMKIFKQLDLEHKNNLIGYATAMLKSQKDIKDIKVRTGYRG